MGRHHSTPLDQPAGQLAARYASAHPGVIDGARQVRSIAAGIGRHRPAPRTERLPRIVATASAPLAVRS